MNVCRWAFILLLVVSPAPAAPPGPVAALAYAPDGKLLAASVYRDVVFIDPATGDIAARLDGLPAPVTALAYSADGRRLVVASGMPGKPSEIRLYPVTGARPASVPVHSIAGHRDAIYALAFSPDGKILATGSYDRAIKLWDQQGGTEIRTLQDHSDSVYGVAFSPDGRLLASVAADRTVKVWDVASGKRLFSLNDATDWLYAIAWHPDGRRLAAGGVDRNIRVWEVGSTEGRLTRAAFAHEGPVTKLAYSPDGRTLYSIGEDRAVKAWDAVTLTERPNSQKQPDTPLALALRPDGKQLAVGRYDGALVLLEADTGKMQAQPLPIKPKPPTISGVSPDFAARGRTILITVTGQSLESVTAISADAAGVTARLRADGSAPNRLVADLTLPITLPAGVITLKALSPAGNASVAFTADLFAVVRAGSPNDTAAARPTVPPDSTIVGAVARMGEVHDHRFEAKAGQHVGAQAFVPPGSKLEPVVLWTDPEGRIVAESTSGAIGFVCPVAGTYTLSVRDRDYRGGAGFVYRLHVGAVPVVTSVFPLGLQRATKREFQINGVFLAAQSASVEAPANAPPGTKLPVPVASPNGPVLGAPSVVVGEHPEAALGQDQLPVPGTANGRLIRIGATQEWRVVAKKGQRLIVEVLARRYGSPMDPRLEVLDSKGQPVQRAVLRCVARQYATFRDHDSSNPNIRLEAWGDLAIDDHILMGNDLMRIEALPKNPDDDCHFYSFGGQRLAFLDTTPEAHANGTPLYKVSIHPPNTTFPPNGLPVVPVFHRNDDGGPGYGKDARLFFDPPADGEYRISVGDSQGRGGPTNAYRLTVRSPQPDFTVSLSSGAPKVWRNGGVPITVTASRLDGFEGPIDVALDGLPPGFHALPSRIDSEQFTTTLGLWADADAKDPPADARLRLVGRAAIGGSLVERQSVSGRATVVEPGDIVTTIEQSDVAIRPGQESYLDVAVERRNGFKGRIPVEVRGLPHGVRVLNIGLNGILITERETARRVVLYAEPWVKSTKQPIVVLASHEGKKTEHAAKPVLLRVEGVESSAASEKR